MNVLVTGAGGFIGSHVIEALMESNNSVTALIKYNSAGNNGWLDHIDHKNINIIHGDVTDALFIRNLCKTQDCVIHLAALIGIPYSYAATESYINTNIYGTFNILNACKEFNIKLIHTSTSEVYGTAIYQPIDEKHPIQTQSPYSATKNAADSLVKSFYSTFNTNITIVRPFNTFGPRQSIRAVIPSIILQALNSNIIFLGNSSTERDFLYVKDTAKAFIKAIEGKPGETYNFGTGQKWSIKQTVAKIAILLKKNLTIQEDKNRLRPIKSEVMCLLCDSAKAQQYLQWKPEFTFEEGLNHTIKWIYKNKNLFENGNYRV